MVATHRTRVRVPPSSPDVELRKMRQSKPAHGSSSTLDDRVAVTYPLAGCVESLAHASALEPCRRVTHVVFKTWRLGRTVVSITVLIPSTLENCKRLTPMVGTLPSKQPGGGSSPPKRATFHSSSRPRTAASHVANGSSSLPWNAMP